MPRKAKKTKTARAAVPQGSVSLLGARLRGLATRYAVPFAVGGATADLGALSVEVQGFGALPLPVADPEPLLEHCRQAPFGHGEATVEDRAVRDTLEAPFEIQAPPPDVLADLALQLGIPEAEVGLVPHKLLIYQPGGHFDWHVDTEKEAGHIATLVLQVSAAPYTGGALRVRHRNDEVCFPFAGEPAGMWAAFFTDCDHKVEPVKSGTRVVLAFNVVRAAEPVMPPLPPADAHVAALVPLVEQAARLNQPLAFVLSHAYTPMHLNEAWLKSGDRAAFQAAKLAAELAGGDLRATLGIVQMDRTYARESTAHLPSMFDDGPKDALLAGDDETRLEEVHVDDPNFRLHVTHYVSLEEGARVVDCRRNDYVDSPWPAVSEGNGWGSTTTFAEGGFPNLPAHAGEPVRGMDFVQGNIMSPMPSLGVKKLNGSFAPSVAVTEAYTGNDGAEARLHYVATAIVFAPEGRLGGPVVAAAE